MSVNDMEGKNEKLKIPHILIDK